MSCGTPNFHVSVSALFCNFTSKELNHSYNTSLTPLEEFDSLTARCLSPNHHPTTTMLDVGYEVFVLVCCVWFHQMHCFA